MKKNIFFSCILLFTAINLFAQRQVTIKLASMAPENTPWGAALNRMANEWRQATNGEVILQVYHNGVAGEEQDVIRKLRLNQIQGAVLTSFGMNIITPEIMTLSVPFLIRNETELAVVIKELGPELETRINNKGFQTLAFANSGWVKIFSKSPVFVPNDLKRQKIGTNSEAPELTLAFQRMGYQMVPVNMNDVLISLNNGMIEAVYLSPAFVGGMQLFGVTKNMASINLAPFMGGMVLNQRAWRAIPEQYRPRIAAISQRIADEIGASISRLENDAIRTMTNYGLVVNQISQEQQQIWYNDVERVMPSLLGSTFDRDIYRKIEDILRRYRSGT